MFQFFRKQKADIHSITIADFGWTNTKKNNTIIQWINPENTIAISVNFFDIPPNIPTIKSVDVLRQFYRNSVSNINGGLIEVDLLQLKEIPFIKTLIKIPQEPSGITYIASLTLPFKTCSFVLKVQAAETGMTGMRDAFVANSLLSNNPAFIEEIEHGWSTDPYDNNFKSGTLMNRSEQQIYDIKFPHHPLTQARQLISQIEKDIQLKSEINKLQPFYNL
jgi:hypothetical protein